MSSIYQLTPAVDGGGATVQFAEAGWPDFGQAVSLDEEMAFELVRPLLAATIPRWTADHWYGFFEFGASETKALTSALLSKAEGLRLDASTRPQATMLAELAVWLQQRIDGLKTVNFHGI